jgi:hypothetical protein
LILFWLIGPRGVNAHCAAQQAAFPSLQLLVNFVVNNDGFWGLWLACVPISLSAI